MTPAGGLRSSTGTTAVLLALALLSAVLCVMVGPSRTATMPTCGCEMAADTCGFQNGTNIQPPQNTTTDDSILCDDCDVPPDHCGLCHGCQDPFVTTNVTVIRTPGGLMTGNHLGSLASLATDSIACGQYHTPVLPVAIPSGVWGFGQEISPPAPQYTWFERRLVEVTGDALGHASDSSANYLLIGNHLSSPKVAHFFGRTSIQASPTAPFSWFFDLIDECGGNQYGYDTAIDEPLQTMAVSDPKAFFSGRVWVYRTSSPDLYQEIQPPAGALRGDRFGHAISMSDNHLVVGSPDCQDGVTLGGCVHFYEWNGTAYEFVNTIVNGPTPANNDELGWQVSVSSDYAFVGYSRGGAVEVYQWDGATWNYFQTITAPGLSFGNKYGYAIDAHGLSVAIGDENYVASPSARGMVFTYRFQGGQWQLWSSYSDSGSSFDTHFGAAVDLSDDFLLIGIPNASPFGKCMLLERNVSQCFGCDMFYNSCEFVDDCGICGGNNTACLGCDNVTNSGAVVDSCGACNGTNTSCIIVDPTAYPIGCNPSQFDPLNCTTIQLGHLYANASFPVNWTIVVPPPVGTYTLNSTSGQFTYCPPLLVEGPVQMTVNVTYISPPADFPPAFNVTNVTLVVSSCAGCDGVNGSGLVFDACGLCGGDNSTCLGCDNVPNSGAVLDQCGICAGSDCCCLDILVPPLVPGPCDPYYLIILSRNPTTGIAHWTITTPPTYGHAVINALTGAIAYYPPSSLVGVGPFDIIVVSVEITTCPITCEELTSESETSTTTETTTDTSSSEEEDSSEIADDGPACCPRITVSEAINLPMVFFTPDPCGVCSGSGTECLGCDGVAGSGLVLDGCGVCGGDGTSCQEAVVHRCDAVCVGFILFMFLLFGLLAALCCAVCRGSACCDLHDDNSCRQRTLVAANPREQRRGQPVPEAVHLDETVISQGWTGTAGTEGVIYRTSRDRRGFWFAPGL